MRTGTQQLVQEVARGVQAWSGIVVPPYRLPFLVAELERLGGSGGAAAAADAFLEGDERVRLALLDRMAICESYFFRHFGHFHYLWDLAHERAARGQSLRVLSAGCASGEEAWSAAAVLADVEASTGVGFSVLGWDLEGNRLAHAQGGSYGPWAARTGLHGYERYFSRQGEHWRVESTLRARVRFERVNLVDRDYPASDRVDVIFFRNVCIYWSSETTSGVLERLSERLRDDGVFLLGPSDPAGLAPTHWQREHVDGAPVCRRRTLSFAARPDARSSVSPRRADPRRKHTVGASSLRGQADAFVPTSRAPTTPAHENGSTWRGEPDEQAEAVEQRARALADVGDYAGALALVTSSALCSDARGRHWQGILLLNLERSAEAVDALRQSVYLDPDNATYRRWLALALRCTDRPEAAEREQRNADAIERRTHMRKGEDDVGHARARARGA